jgi:thiol-disulfide isomerase/thioredoxin
MPGAIGRGWRGLSGRKRTMLALVFGVLAWEGVMIGLRLIDRPTLSETQVTKLSGESTHLAALADGKPMVVNLWASWCPPCRREMPVLAAAQKRETWASFVFANQGESRATVQNYLSAGQLELANVVLDRETKIGFVAGSSALPITLFYSASGQLVATHLGALSAASLTKRLNALRPH